MKLKIIFILFLLCLFLWSNDSFSQGVLEEMQKEMAGIVEKASPSIVTISTKTSQLCPAGRNDGILSFFRDERTRTVYYQRICSGLVYNDEGYIITKSNVLYDHDEITVTLSDGTSIKPIYVGREKASGITVLKVGDKELAAPHLSDRGEIPIGSWAAVIGNSMGVSPTISMGIISGHLPDGMLQLSTIVSPGNNGSPIFDLQGNVIGLLVAMLNVDDQTVPIGHNHAIFSEVGIALSIHRIREIVDDIIASYEEDLGWLGIQFRANPELPTAIIEIYDIVLGSPADQAGLRKGDKLVKYYNHDLSNCVHLGDLIRKTKPGSVVPVSFLRNNTLLNVFVKVGDRNNHFDGVKQ